MNEIIIAAADSLTCNDAEKAQKSMSRACNTFSLNKNEFVCLIRQNRAQSMVWNRICWSWVSNLSQMHVRKEYDDRNRQSCYIGYCLQQAIDKKFESLQSLPHDDFTSNYVQRMARDHRTLQQSFTTLVFAWLDFQAAEKRDQKTIHAITQIKAEHGKRWYALPMI